MAHVPDAVDRFSLAEEGESLADYLATEGWVRIHRGKVRDTYANGNPEEMTVVATDRLSIFDFVLPVLVPRKGEVLTALTHFWLNYVLTDTPHHLLPKLPDLAFPAHRTLVVKKVPMQPYELIFRHHIGGSVWKQYLKDGTAGGHVLPPGLTKWQRLDEPLFTPSTKAEIGHDVNITAADYLQAMGEGGRTTDNLLAEIYKQAYRYAAARGICILDTKFECSLPIDELGQIIIADEVLTPDSSRFASTSDLEDALAEGRDPTPFDKQLVRDWGMTVPTPFGVTGINQLDPENHDHVAFVDELTVPRSIIAETASRYQQIFAMLVGVPLDRYQADRMNFR